MKRRNIIKGGLYRCSTDCFTEKSEVVISSSKMIIKKNYVMIRRKNSNDKECSVESSLEVGMLSKSTFNDQELDNYLRQGEIKACEKPPVPPQIYGLEIVP